jgi:hypothetical protein
MHRKPALIFPVGIEHALDVAVQRPHDAYDIGDIGRTYPGDDHRDDRRL